MKNKFIAISMVLAASTVLAGCSSLQVNKGDNPTTGVEATDGFIFSDLTNVTTLPTFAQLPKEINGWKQVDLTEGEYNSASYEKDNGCTFVASIGSTYSMEGGQGDYFSSKKLFYSLPESEGGTPAEESMVTVKSNEDDINFVSGTYKPTSYFDGDRAMEDNFGVIPLDGDYTTFFAVRTIDSLSDAATTVEVEEGAITDLSGNMMIKYTCETANYQEKDALNMIAQLSINIEKS